MPIGEEFAHMSLKVTLEAAKLTFEVIADIIKRLAHMNENDIQGKQSIKSLVHQGKAIDALNIENKDDAKTLEKVFKGKGINYSVEKDKESGNTKFYFQEKDAFFVAEAKEYVIEKYLNKELKLTKDTFEEIKNSVEKSDIFTLSKEQALKVNDILKELLDFNRFAINVNETDASKIDLVFYGNDIKDIQTALQQAEKKLSDKELTPEFKKVLEKAERDVEKWKETHAKEKDVSKGRKKNIGSPSPAM